MSTCRMCFYFTLCPCLSLLSLRKSPNILTTVNFQIKSASAQQLLPQKAQTLQPPLSKYSDEKTWAGCTIFQSQKMLCFGVLVYDQSPQNTWTNMLLQIHQHSEISVQNITVKIKKRSSGNSDFWGENQSEAKKNSGSNFARALFTCIIVHMPRKNLLYRTAEGYTWHTESWITLWGSPSTFFGGCECS